MDGNGWTGLGGDGGAGESREGGLHRHITLCLQEHVRPNTGSWKQVRLFMTISFNMWKTKQRVARPKSRARSGHTVACLALLLPGWALPCSSWSSPLPSCPLNSPAFSRPALSCFSLKLVWSQSPPSISPLNPWELTTCATCKALGHLQSPELFHSPCLSVCADTCHVPPWRGLSPSLRDLLYCREIERVCINRCLGDQLTFLIFSALCIVGDYWGTEFHIYGLSKLILSWLIFQTFICSLAVRAEIGKIRGGFCFLVFWSS